MAERQLPLLDRALHRRREEEEEEKDGVSSDESP